VQPRIVLFDLDGTLSDSAPGILAALRHAFDVHRIPRLDARAERELLGPPFYESLPPIVGADRLRSVIGTYRERYDTTMYDTAAYPGVRDVLSALVSAGRRLAVATSKPAIYARPIVEHLGLLPYFETIGGDSADGTRPTKALVIEHVLRQLGDPDPRDVVMVGDRSHDVLGARAHGIDCVAVTWGYAVPGELARARPALVVDTAAELAVALGVGVGAQAR
jgi:phosphoglycolate phosphatase